MAPLLHPCKSCSTQPLGWFWAITAMSYTVIYEVTYVHVSLYTRGDYVTCNRIIQTLAKRCYICCIFCYWVRLSEIEWKEGLDFTSHTTTTVALYFALVRLLSGTTVLDPGPQHDINLEAITRKPIEWIILDLIPHCRPSKPCFWTSKKNTENRPYNAAYYFSVGRTDLSIFPIS